MVKWFRGTLWAVFEEIVDKFLFGNILIPLTLLPRVEMRRYHSNVCTVNMQLEPKLVGLSFGMMTRKKGKQLLWLCAKIVQVVKYLPTQNVSI